MNIEGKRAVVTGGSRGIGAAIVEALAARGADTAVVYRSNRDKAEKVAESARKHGRRSVAIQADLRDWDSVQELVSSAVEELGGIDILINSAGLNGPSSLLDDISPEEWRDVLDTNLTGTFYCCKAAAAQLKHHRGKVVNLSSIAGKMGGTIGSHYAASKGGIISLTFALATELAPEVMVNAIAPGPVDTELITEEVKEKLSKLTPFGRIAEPEEIAHTAMYLLENDYVTGEVIDVNAGRYKD